ncbi:hypothetical protein D3C77_351580 [compost metagenome]
MHDEARSEPGDDQTEVQPIRKYLPAHFDGHEISSDLGVFKYAAGMDQLHDVRHQRKQQACRCHHQHHGSWDVALRVASFLGHCSDRIETQIGIGRHGRRCRHTKEGATGVPEWRGQCHRRLMDQVDNAQHHKQQHKGDAQPCQQFVCPVGKAKPQDVHQRGQANVYQHPAPERYARELHIEKNRLHQPGDHGHEQIVQQHKPADQKPQLTAQHLPGVEIGGSGNGKQSGHLGVAQCRQQHGAGSQQEGGRRRAGAALGNDAENHQH